MVRMLNSLTWFVAFPLLTDTDKNVLFYMVKILENSNIYIFTQLYVNCHQN